MDRNWNRGGTTGVGGEKMHKQTYSGGQHYQNQNQNQNQHYRKKNDYSGQEYYNKKTVSSQPLKKEGLQVALVENELMDSNFSWLKNSGTYISP
jgi:hypothetical protein